VALQQHGDFCVLTTQLLFEQLARLQVEMLRFLHVALIVVEHGESTHSECEVLAAPAIK
jgi:hypothetical protein